MKIILFGTGITAERFFYHCSLKCEIMYCLDNNAEGAEYFHQIPVFKPSLANIKKYFIIVASAYYTEIADQLKTMGLLEFYHFTCDKIFEKKVAILHGNCHNSIIMQYLFLNNEFSKQYAFYPIPMICNSQKGEIEESVLKKCDLFIHQDIQKNNKYGFKLSDEYILPLLNKKCKVISIPNLLGMGGGLFPNLKILNRNNRPYRNDANAFFPFEDTIIDKYVNCGMSIEKIIDKIMYEKVFTAQEVEDNLQRNFEKMERREVNWDIKIVDFIKSNLRQHKCFFEINHPSNIVLHQISQGILNHLGLGCQEKYETLKYCLDEVEVPIYSCVREYLGIEFKEEEIRKYSEKKFCYGKMNCAEYIREYIYWCYRS